MMQAMDGRLFKFLALALGLSAPLAAQQVQPCGRGGDFRFETTAMAIAEPWAANTRSFAGGDIRIAVMDTGEPALAAYYLLVMFWPGGGAGGDIRTCGLVSGGALGFVEITLEGLESRYDPARGLVLEVPATFYNPARDAFEDGVIEVLIDRAANRITASRR